ncbi:MAG: DUF2961 domain-containing protein [Pirellulaceae bacterium]
MRILVNRWLLVTGLLAAIGAPSSSAGAETHSYASLVRRLLDLERLAVLPADGETCQQWSSYDRASRYDASSGKYVAWDANGDGDQFIRQEGETHVMAEMKGPGCIWRIWSATAEQGHVKIYLDDQETPAVDLPFREYFTGKSQPFAYPALSYQLVDVGSRGHNLYVPIPYQKSCKVVAEKGWGAYYHIVYSTFPAETVVPTFRRELPAEDVAALQEVNAFLTSQLGQDPAGARAGERTVADTVVMAAGSSQQLELTGSRAITAIRGYVECGDREDEMAALRQLLLSITFDDHSQPSVWTPLGDFFGTAPGKNLYRSLPTGCTAEGAYAYWYMPFAKRAKIELKNEGLVDRTIRFEIVHAPLARSFDGLGHFCARWHRDLAPVSADRVPDWRILQATGRGRFCGVMLHVWNPKGGWWGEGDEKFFVDGETFPSTIGTGSEDYFGYAWCHPGLFQFAYHGQTMTENNRGHQSVMRWHITDNIPFQKSFEAYIEKYYPNSVGTLYACLPCYYLHPDHEGSGEPVPVEQRHGYYVKLPAGGAGFQAVGEPPGNVEEQGLAGFGRGQWKDDNQLWWTGAKPGDKLNLRLPVEQDGRYAVEAYMTKAIDYGIVQLWIDGRKAGPPLDLFHEGVVPTGPVTLGTHQLAAGEHILTVEIVGANPKAVKAYMFGLDQVLLHRQ